MATEFYRKNEVSYDTLISPQFADAYLGQESTIEIRGGNIIKKGIFEFKVADAPQFGNATLFRGKLGMYANTITQGKNQPKISAFLMKRELSDNSSGNEEGALELQGSQMLQVGAKPTNATFWEENYDTDKTINNASATEVENIAGTVRRQSNYAIFVEDLISFLDHGDITGGDKGWTGWFDLEEFSGDFDQFMDDETQYVQDHQGLREWLIKNYAVKATGFGGGSQVGGLDLKFDTNIYGAGIMGGMTGGVAGAIVTSPGAPLGAPVAGFAAGAVVGGVAGMAGYAQEEGVITPEFDNESPIDPARSEYIILLDLEKRSCAHDYLVPKNVRSGAVKWWVHYQGSGMGGLAESGKLLKDVEIISEATAQSEDGILGRVTPENSMAFKVRAQEPKFTAEDIDTEKLKSIGRVNFTKNNTLSGMNMIMKNVWNYDESTTDPTLCSPPLMGHQGKMNAGQQLDSQTHVDPLGLADRQECMVTYGKLPRPAATNTYPCYPIGQNPNDLNLTYWSGFQSNNRNGHVNSWVFNNPQGIEVSFEIYFDNLSPGFISSPHPEDIGPGAEISTTDGQDAFVLGPGGNPYTSSRENDYFDGSNSAMTILDDSDDTTRETQNITDHTTSTGNIDTDNFSLTATTSDTAHVHIRSSVDTNIITCRRGFHVVLGQNAPADDQTFADYILHNLNATKGNFLLSFIRMGDSNVTTERMNKINVLWQDRNDGNFDVLGLNGRPTWLPYKGAEDGFGYAKNKFTDIRWANLHRDEHKYTGTGTHRNKVLTLDTGRWYKVRLMIREGLGTGTGSIVDVETGNRIEHPDGTTMRDMQIGPGPGAWIRSSGTAGPSEISHLDSIDAIGDKISPPDVGTLTNDADFPNYLSFWNNNYKWDTDEDSATKKPTHDLWTGQARDGRDMETKVQIDSVKIIGGNWDKNFATIDDTVPISQRDFLTVTNQNTIAGVGATLGDTGVNDGVYNFSIKNDIAAPYILCQGYNNAKDVPYMVDYQTSALSTTAMTLSSKATTTASTGAGGLGFTDQGQGTDIGDDFYKGAMVINRGSASDWYSAEITGYTHSSGVCTIKNMKKKDGSAGASGGAVSTVTITNDVYTLFNDYSTSDSSITTELSGTPISAGDQPCLASGNNIFLAAGAGTWANETQVAVASGSGTEGAPQGGSGSGVKMTPASAAQWSTDIAIDPIDASGSFFSFWCEPSDNWVLPEHDGTNNQPDTELFEVRIGSDASNYWSRKFYYSQFKNGEETYCTVALDGKNGDPNVTGTPVRGEVDYIKIIGSATMYTASSSAYLTFWTGLIESVNTSDVMASFSHNLTPLGALGRQDYVTKDDYHLTSNDYGKYSGAKTTGLTVGNASKEVAISYGASSSSNASVKGFTSKGWVRWRFSAHADTVLGPNGAGWGDDPSGTASNDNIREGQSVSFSKRENILASARILQVGTTKIDAQGNPVGTVVTIDRPDVITSVPTDTKFILFQEGQAYGTTTNNWNSGGYRLSNISIKPQDITGNQVFIKHTDDISALLNEDNVNTLFLGPFMYWTTLRFSPGASQATPITFPIRKYRNVINTRNPFTVAIDGETTLSDANRKSIGPTWNEYTWNNNAYANQWQMDLATDYPAYTVKKDWGFGAATDDNPEMGYCAQDYVTTGWNEIDINNIFSNSEKGAGDSISLLVGPQKEGDGVVFNFDSSEGTNKPYLLTTFVDERPTPPTLALVKEDDKDARLAWNNSDSDLWYGLLHIDDEVITSQYHNCVAYIPMDEGPTVSTSYRLYRFDQTDKFYFRPTIRTGGNTVTNANFNTSPSPNIEGLAGYAAEYTQVTNDTSKIQGVEFGTGSASIYTEPTTYNQFTFSTHVIPDSGSYTKRYIAHQKGKFSIWLDSNNKVNARVYYQKGTGTITTSGTSRMQRDGHTYYAIGNGTTDDEDTGDDIIVQTDAAHNLATGDMVLISGATQTGYNGYYPHITAAASTVSDYTQIFHMGPVLHDIAAENGTATWTGFNYIELKGSTSIPSDGAVPTHIALLVDAEASDSNVTLYINGKVEDMTGKALSVGDTTHWQSGATLMKSNEQLIIGNGLEVDFGIVQHAADDSGSNAIYDSFNLAVSADDYFNNMLVSGLQMSDIADSDINTAGIESITAPWIKGTAGTPDKAGDKYSILSHFSFDGKIEETCIWNQLVFPVGADDNSFSHQHLHNMQELPDSNTNAGSLNYNMRLFMKDYHNIRGARPSRIATSNQLAWRKPSFSLNTN